jgi:hypothetical protein
VLLASVKPGHRRLIGRVGTLSALAHANDVLPGIREALVHAHRHLPRSRQALAEAA